jgi:hypothetical protein
MEMRKYIHIFQMPVLLYSALLLCPGNAVPL